MGRVVVYLDQNFASNLAKVENLAGWNDPDRHFYRELLALLRTRAREDKLVCPTGPFHRYESEKSMRVKDFVWKLVEELSNGLSFKHGVDIYCGQVVTAALDYCGLPRPDVPSWAVAFNRDPNQPAGSNHHRSRILVHLSTPEGLVNYFRTSDVAISGIYNNFKRGRRGKSQSYVGEADVQKRQFVYETLLCPPPETPPELDRFVGSLGRSRMIEFQRNIADILNHSDSPRQFVASPNLLECPFVHIRASLMAADVYFSPQKLASASLNVDFDIVASVLPYVDILATDGYVSELINRSGLRDRFRAKVFPMKERRALMQTLREL